MRIWLRGKGLWKIVAGDEKPPGVEDLTLLSKYEQRLDVALTDTLLSIEKSCRHAVITLEDPKEVRDKLRTVYKGVADA